MNSWVEYGYLHGDGHVTPMGLKFRADENTPEHLTELNGEAVILVKRTVNAEPWDYA